MKTIAQIPPASGTKITFRTHEGEWTWRVGTAAVLQIEDRRVRVIAEHTASGDLVKTWLESEVREWENLACIGRRMGLDHVEEDDMSPAVAQ